MLCAPCKNRWLSVARMRQEATHRPEFKKSDSAHDPGTAGESDALGVRIEVTNADKITFATHQADIPVLSELRIFNDTDETLEDLTVHMSSDPPILGERVWAVDRIENHSEYHVRDRRISLSGGLLDALTERMLANVTFELKHGDKLITTLQTQITALAHNEWGGALSMPELLGAFVLPNDPATAKVLKAASQILEAAGKSPSLDGYQRGSAQATWEIISAIWSAISSMNLVYAEPPTSFEKHGQKVRFPTEMDEQGLATCLDTALLFAATLELAGLHPLVVFTKGHALAGAWLKPTSLSGLTTEDPAELRKAIAANELVLFETTFATHGQRLIPFTAALKEGARKISENEESDFVYALDIKRSRDRDIRPLPLIKDRGNQSTEKEAGGAGTSVVMEEAPSDLEFDEAFEPEDQPASPGERFDRWQRSLLDLTKRNRLLNFRATQSSLVLYCPEPLHLNELLAAGKKIKLIPSDAAAERDQKQYLISTGAEYLEQYATKALRERRELVIQQDKEKLNKSIITLFRKARNDLEEGGSNTLFLGMGMLRWRVPGESQNRTYRAPIVMLPVQLVRPSAVSQPRLTLHADDPVFNLTLLQMLSQDFQIDLSEFASELPLSADGSVDLERIWRTVRRKVQAASGLEVVEEVVLGTFSFAKYLMWKDLSERTDLLKRNSFVKHILDTPRESYGNGAQFLDVNELDRKLNPADLFAPLNADSSQLRAIDASAGTGDFVLEGPPGTGKSETIANIIAHNLALGKRVLFVSEKIAALNVVYDRLAAVGLGDFCLELHSSKANKKQVLGQLDSAWQKRTENSGDEWAEKARHLKEIRDELNGMVEALHAPTVAGMSARKAVGRALRFGDVHRFRLDWPADLTVMTAETGDNTLTALEDTAKRLGQQFSILEPEDLQVFADITRDDWSFSWAGQLVDAAEKLTVSITSLKEAGKAATAEMNIPLQKGSIGEYRLFCRLADFIANGRAPAGYLVFSSSKFSLTAMRKLHEHLQAMHGAIKRAGSGVNLDNFGKLPAKEWQTALAAALNKPWPIKAFARRALRKQIRAELGNDNGSIREPEKALQHIRAAQNEFQKAVNIAEELGIGAGWEDLMLESERTAAVISAAEELSKIIPQLMRYGHKREELREQLQELFRSFSESGDIHSPAIEDLIHSMGDFQGTLEVFQTQSSSERAWEAHVLTELEQTATDIITRERRLNVWCQWVAVSREAQHAGLNGLIEALKRGSVNADDTVEALRTAFACWLAPLLIDATPELKRFSRVRHEDLIATFRRLDEQVAQLSVDYIRAQLSGNVVSRDGLPGRNRSSGYGLLAREIQKKQRHKPVRQLLQGMGPALTALTPCLMMSPLSVAQFLPADLDAFDLVVFDEASQITVPDAIGAIARGKRCIIVGDPKQLPPTMFFNRQDDEYDDDIQDLESILDEALAARVPHLRLTGHYRSRHESLIAFSNHAYYGGSLITYPSADTSESAVMFRRVDGVYARGGNRTNPKEAQAVVAEIIARLRDPDRNHLSIGVVTMNSSQQQLIEDLLDAERRKDPELERFFMAKEDAPDDDRPEPVFVKNLESVQGDQRDVILLSVTYGPTEPGAQTMPLNFGPLNKVGGERRLNVAITRATTDVSVFASFEPGMIDLSRSSADGLRDLKHYLEFAERGPVALGQAIRSISDDAYDSDFERAVAERLRNKGWSVKTQVGVSKFRIDLGIVNPDLPGSFLAGIECDGATYHSSPTARDRDRIRQMVLENLGWNILRVWSTDFFVDEQSAVDALDDSLTNLLSNDRAVRRKAEAEQQKREKDNQNVATRESRARKTSGESSEQHAATEFTPAIESPQTNIPQQFRSDATFISESTEAPPPKHVTPLKTPAVTHTHAEPDADGEQFYEDAYRPQLIQLVQTVIDAEGPITFKLLATRVARQHGFRRTGKQIKRTIWQAAKQSERQSQTTADENTTFWPQGIAPSDRYPFRGLNVAGHERTWRDLPLCEKIDLLRTADGQSVEETARKIAETLGMRRVTPRFVESVTRSLLHAAEA